jgi:hypothetical protein
MLRKRTEITIETSRVYIFTGAVCPALAWCALCAAEVLAVAPEVAAALAAAQSPDPPDSAHRDLIHYTESRAGEPPLVCLNSPRVETGIQEGEAQASPFQPPAPGSY